MNSLVSLNALDIPVELIEDSPELAGTFILMSEAACRIAFGLFTKPPIGPKPYLDFTFSGPLLDAKMDEEQGRYRLAFDQITSALANGALRAVGVKQVRISDEPGYSRAELAVPFTLPADYVAQNDVYDNFSRRLGATYRVGEHWFEEILIEEQSFNRVFGALVAPSATARERRTEPPFPDYDGIAPEKSRGRPPKFDWLAAMTHVAALLAQRGVPKTQALIEDWVAEYFSETFDEEPSRSLIRQKVSPLYEKLRQKGQ